MNNPVNRRAFMGGTAAAALSIGAASKTATAGTPAGEQVVKDGFVVPVQASVEERPTIPDIRGDYAYEVTRTEEEWRAMLDDEEYNILRKGSTELPETSDLWDNYERGTYHCKGCDLKVFDSYWKVDVGLGWAFFQYGVPDAILNGIDGPVVEYGQQMGGPDSMIELHCRRCGSHLGHIVRISRDPLHCIDGKALTFTPVSA